MVIFNIEVRKFPYDWVGQKLKDIEFVFDTLRLIEKDSMTESEKERIKVRFLLNKFFNDHSLDDLQKILFEKHQKTAD